MRELRTLREKFARNLELNNLFYTALKIAPVGVSIYDTDFNYLLYNPKNVEVWGPIQSEGDGQQAWAEDYGLFCPHTGRRFDHHELPGIAALDGCTTEGLIHVRNEYVDHVVWLRCVPIDKAGQVVYVITFAEVVESGKKQKKHRARYDDGERQQGAAHQSGRTPEQPGVDGDEDGGGAKPCGENGEPVPALHENICSRHHRAGRWCGWSCVLSAVHYDGEAGSTEDRAAT